MVSGGVQEFLQSCFHCSALRMSEDDNKSCRKTVGRKLDAPDERRRNNVSCHSDDEQITESLVEHNLCRNPRIRTTQKDRDRLLSGGQCKASGGPRVPWIEPVLREPPVAFAELDQGIAGRNHDKTRIVSYR